jgi:hypothetical protein
MSIEAQQLEQIRQIEIVPAPKKGLRCDIGEPMHISDDTIEAYRSVLANSGVTTEDINKCCTQVAEIVKANHVPDARVRRRNLASVLQEAGELLDGKPNPEPAAIPVSADIVVLKRG